MTGGDCGEWYYPTSVWYADNRIFDSMEISLQKDHVGISSWRIKSAVDTAFIPFIGDSILSDTVLAVRFRTRATGFAYHFSLQDPIQGDFFSIGPALKFSDTVSYSIPLRQIKFLLGLRNPNNDSQDLYVHSRASDSTAEGPSDTVKLVSFDLMQKLSDSSMAKIRRYLNQ